MPDAFDDNEALVKRLTGGDQLKGGGLYQKGYYFTPQFKLWVGVNHLAA